MTTLTIGENILKVDELIIVILNDEKLKKSDSNKDGVFVANSSYTRSIHVENNFKN